MQDHIKLLTIDFDRLPAELLCAAKAHLRVEFDRDDQYIRGALGRAIAEVESVGNLSVNPAAWEWTPRCWRASNSYRLPKQPVRYLRDTATGQDVDLLWDENTAYLRREHHGLDQTFELGAGYADASCIPPVVVNAILMLVGTLYEQREAVQMGTFTELPDMANRLLAGLWRPSV